LLDEPLSNLDAGLRAQMRAEIRKLHEELSATFVYVTHDQTEAMTMADRVVVLNEGVIQQAGPPREVYAQPRTTFVASFLGSPRINLVRPEVLDVPPERLGGRNLIVGLRPEHTRVVVADAPPPSIQGEVYVVEALGTDTWVTIEIGGERITGRAADDFPVRGVRQAHLTYNIANLLFFDAETGERVDAG
jgi:multiple sugar transport system ATP-binding protein